MKDSERAIPSERVAGVVDGYSATTIPVSIQLEGRQTILSEPEAEGILRAADRIALGPCGCRKSAGACDAPIDVCLAVGEDADVAISSWQGFRRVSASEAERALRVSHEAGLVHLAYRRGDQSIRQFCSCCSCCCWFLNRLQGYDYHEAIIASRFVAAHDRDACTACGMCVKRCHFQAWTADGLEKPTLEDARCFGCGVCATSCPAGAIRLVPRHG